MSHAFMKYGFVVPLVMLAAGCVANADTGEDEKDEAAQGASSLMKSGGGYGSSCTFETCGGTLNPFGKCTAVDPYGRCTQCESGGAKAMCGTDPGGVLVCKQIYCSPTKSY